MITLTPARPAACRGETTVSLVLEATLSWLPLADPKSTARTPVKFLPLTVTLVPPAVEPEDGDTFDTDGRAACPA